MTEPWNANDAVDANKAQQRSPTADPAAISSQHPNETRESIPKPKPKRALAGPPRAERRTMKRLGFDMEIPAGLMRWLKAEADDNCRGLPDQVLYLLKSDWHMAIEDRQLAERLAQEQKDGKDGG